MENNISPLIAGQLPEYIQESTPLFKDFLVTYFQYASQRDKSIGLVQNNPFDMDIDETQDAYLSKFYATYGEYLPKEIAYDKRHFIKLLNKIYESKGTEKSLKLIFKLLFNDSVTVSYPTEQVLRASGGNWTQENFITVATKFGQLPTDAFRLSISNATGDYAITITKTVRVSSTDVRMYFRAFDRVAFIADQLVYVYGDARQIVYMGQIGKSPSKLIIKAAGAGWQHGQVIVIEGNGTPTISRVTSVNSTGGITGVEILSHGSAHVAGQMVTISPYPNRPTSSSVDFTSKQVSPGVFHHTLKINEFTDGTSETITATSNAQNDKSYFLENYMAQGYTGFVAINQVNTQVIKSEIEDMGLSISDWLASRATFLYETENVVKTKGFYADDAGKISNQEIRVQDSYYYQPFSYVMNSAKDISEYQHVLNITHPAGTKRFSNIVKSNEYTFNFKASREIT